MYSTRLVVDLFGLAGVTCAAAFILGGTHLESLSQAVLVGDFIHLEVSGAGFSDPDGHCHELADGGVAGPVGLGAGVVAAGVVFLGFTMTLLGQLNLRPVGIFDLYLGADDVAVALPEEPFDSFLLAGI